MSEWNRPNVFVRSSNIYTFSRNPLPQRNKYCHLFIPWSEKKNHDLLFKIKSHINENESCLIPFMDEDFKKAGIKPELYQQLVNQAQLGVETHLIMSNLDSIHILKVKNIYEQADLTSELRNKALDNFKAANQYTFWVEIEDFFVYRANHSGVKREEIIQDLDRLIEGEQNQNVFVPIQQLDIYAAHESEKLRVNARKWIELNRNLTYDYFIRSCELEENIYQDTWKGLAKRTQHCLIMSEQLRHKGILYKDHEKLTFFKESFESYISALINELNEIYINPLSKVYQEYDSLQEIWQGLQDGLVHPELKSIMNYIFNSPNNQVATLETFLIYMKHAKTCLFSMKHKYEKKIGKEEYLLMENFLAKQENLIESFLCKKLDHKLEGIIEVKNWLQHIIEGQENLNLSELKDCTLKLSHLITIMTSASYQDNLFFQLTEQKTLKGIVRKSFEDEVKDLTKLYLHKVA